jgi:formylglycine-generating enzyme required for sulfatase activity
MTRRSIANLCGFALLLVTCLRLGPAMAAGETAWQRPGERLGQEITGPHGAPMVWVPAGQFTMGSEHGAANEAPLQTMTVPGYWMDRYEVTNRLFCAFLATMGRQVDDAGHPLFLDEGYGDLATGDTVTVKPGRENYPVVEVTWYGALAFAQHFGLTLPIEPQWEYAARGPESRLYPWGNEWQSTRCCNGAHWGPGRPGTMPVGSFPNGASWCGVYDLAGNVWEWCLNWCEVPYAPPAPGAPPLDTDRFGAGLTEHRAMRGGGWFDGSFRCRGSMREPGESIPRYGSVGFRCLSVVSQP